MTLFVLFLSEKGGGEKKGEKRNLFQEFNVVTDALNLFEKILVFSPEGKKII